MRRRVRLPGRRRVDVDLTRAPDPADDPAALLAARVRAGRAVFRGITPVPHLVIEDALVTDTALRASLAMSVAMETSMIPPLAVDDPLTDSWSRGSVIPHSVAIVLALLESRPMEATLRELTGRADLAPDRTHAAGGFEVVPGGRPVRLDDEQPPPARLALTVLLFVGPGWRGAWGGALTLTGPTGVVSYVPRFNRLVVVARDPSAPVELEPPTGAPEATSRCTIVSHWFTDADAPITLPEVPAR